ncbi:outer membrane beta-barrel protein [Xanthocytophaga agilis]|uniref:Outer membrane beta-barrel protein n=1 Tax=Xanthocytophaga agilis TaxID=3048010 RepID=A0AAE3R4A5_9BACT|nr:outer membrane beta-barrel protein [Xanthocytophaga agilis]MDJ1501129.1 outer membrane beta-barrel protein [Xanthocytophaga agilis]
MKKIFILSIAVFSFFVFITEKSVAQTDKGNFMVGSSIANLNFDEDYSSIALSPTVGYFVIDNLVVGLTPSIGYTSSKAVIPGDTYKTTTLGIGPFARYYFGSGSVKPLVHADYSYLHMKNRNNISGNEWQSTSSYSNVKLGAGVAYFINNYVSVDGIVSYNRIFLGSGNDVGSVKISFGFQIFLD